MTCLFWEIQPSQLNGTSSIIILDLNNYIQSFHVRPEKYYKHRLVFYKVVQMLLRCMSKILIWNDLIHFETVYLTRNVDIGLVESPFQHTCL
jgi:hypothetical protein